MAYNFLKGGDSLLRISRAAGAWNYRSGVSLGAILFFLNIFRPYPDSLSGVAQVFWFDAFVGVFAVLVVFGRGRRLPLLSPPALLLVCFGLSALIIPVIFADSFGKLSYLLRVVYYFIVWVAFYRGLGGKEGVMINYAKIVSFSCIPMLPVVISQLWHVYLLSDWIHLLYGTEKLRSFDFSSPRVFGTFYNANWFGVYATVVVASVGFLFISGYVRVMSWFFLMFVALFFLLASGSRTALLGASIVFAWQFMCSLCTVKKRQSVVFLGGVTFWVGAILVAFSYLGGKGVRLFGRFEELFSGTDVSAISSAAGRFYTWEKAVEAYVQSPWVGIGSDFVAHNSVLTIAIVFGVPGIFLMLLLIVFLLLGFVRRARGEEKLVAVVFVAPVLLGFFLMSLTAEFFFATQIILLLLPLIGWILGGYRDSKFAARRMDALLSRVASARIIRRGEA